MANKKKTRAGFVAILGAPNAGKSTLLNALVGQKLAIVTPKAQTTRSPIRGICMAGDSQLVFVDTPGVFEPDHKFEKAMVASAWSGAADADVIVVMVDATRHTGHNTKTILNSLKEQGKQAVLVLNKVDLIKQKHQLLEWMAEFDAWGIFSEIFIVSATQGDGLDELKKHLAGAVPESPWLYPPDQVTDISERLLASEITREKLFMALAQELPYTLTVETESFEEQKNGSIKIGQVIYVQRESQKQIVLGKGGAMIKRIGQQSREELTQLWGRKIHLFLFVKVREKWKENPEIYQYLGLNE